MAVNYATQTQTSSFNNHLPLYGAQQVSPSSMTSSPSNLSPTSPRLNNSYISYQLPSQIRQIRPPKTPLYIPAVLRPTEYPIKQSPPTPPKSLHSSIENLETADFEAELLRRADEEGLTPQELLAEQSWLGEEPLGNVTGLPTRDHWKPDAASPSCDSPKCRSSFNIFTRKHHCRHCGHIFCSSHTPHIIPLDQEARFHPEGNPSRACEYCFHAFRRWDVARTLSRKNSQTSNNSQPFSDSTPTTPLAGAKTIGNSQQNKGANDAAAAASVPKDWQWSTF